MMNTKEAQIAAEIAKDMGVEGFEASDFETYTEAAAGASEMVFPTHTAKRVEFEREWVRQVRAMREEEEADNLPC